MLLAVVLQIIFKITGNQDNPSAQLQISNLFYIYPPFIAATIPGWLVGLCARRFGPGRILVWGIPVVAMSFLVPIVLFWRHDEIMLFLAGCSIFVSYNVFPQTQAVVPCIVPPSRLGETYGIMSA